MKLGEGMTPGPLTVGIDPNDEAFFAIWKDQDGTGYTVAEGIGNINDAKQFAKTPLLVEARDNLAALVQWIEANAPDLDNPDEWCDQLFEARALLAKLEAK